jgi:ATP-dependent Lon protease
MEILNPEENNNFMDHYLEVKVDFSRTIFIMTANEVMNIFEPIRNRIEIIDVNAYVEEEKVNHETGLIYEEFFEGKQLAIAKNYLHPKILKENGLSTQSIVYDDATLQSIIQGWCYYESGVRELQRCLDKISRKHAVKILENLQSKNIELYKEKPATSSLEQEVSSQEGEEVTTSDSRGGVEPFAHQGESLDGSKGRKRLPGEVEKSSAVQIDDETIVVDEESPNEVRIRSGEKEEPVVNPQAFEAIERDQLIFDSGNPEENEERLKKYLGIPVFSEEFEKRKARKSLVGVCNVLTVAGFVGEVLTVEAVFDQVTSEKKGQLTVSGNLKKVLEESVSIAKINAARYLSPEQREILSQKNIHLHFMQGSAPKDGPSAGTAICTVLISLISDRPVPTTVGMTGEISLSGDVHRIGGLQAKVTACKTLGITTILVPKGNAAEWDQLPSQLKKGLEVFFVGHYDEIYEIVFCSLSKGNPLQNVEKPSL